MNTTTETSTPVPAIAENRPAGIRYIAPPVSISEDSDGYTLEAELPGVAKDNVTVTVADGELIFTGTKSYGPTGTRIYGERAKTDYRRVFDLDPAVDASKITAKMEQGVLVVRLPKTPESKPRRITVTG